MFRDVLEEIMEAELGYEKQERRSDDNSYTPTKNYPNGYSKQKVKTQLGEVEINIPRDRKLIYTTNIIEG